MRDSALIPETVKIPQQKRSRDKFNAMVAAAESLFAKQGVPKTSVAQIVETAGVSIGAFYQRFENKDALIHTIFYLLENEIHALDEIAATSEERSLEETVALFISTYLEFYNNKRGVILAMLLAVQENSNIREYAATVRIRILDSFTTALTPYKAQIGARRFKTATPMAMRMINSYVDQYVIWEGYKLIESELSYAASNKELVKAITSYLLSK